MNIVYFSQTGNTKKFISKVSNYFEQIKTFSIESFNLDEPFILITSTTGFGEIPTPVQTFLNKNDKNLCGVIGSGNKNWGSKYCLAAKKIANIYNVPLLLTFELAGNNQDIDNFKNIILNWEEKC